MFDVTNRAFRHDRHAAHWVEDLGVRRVHLAY
jgi:hypothetical protein